MTIPPIPSRFRNNMLIIIEDEDVVIKDEDVVW